MTSTKNLFDASAHDKNKTPRMTNTKPHEQATPSHGESQPHHQDLIRLLAQHFNNQFYQITNNQQQLPPLIVSSNESPALLQNLGNSTVNFQSPLLLSQYQNQLRANQEAMNFMIQSGRQVLHPDAPPGSSAQTHSSRPQQHHSSSGPCHQQHQAHNSTINSNPLAGNPLFGDRGVNLFNALNCFSVTNDQFLFSLQQQYLLQAASNVRQMESRQTNASNSNASQLARFVDTNQQSKLGQNLETLQGNIEINSIPATSGRGEKSTGENQSGRELLKFSINTILGRGSPASSAKDETKSAPSNSSAFMNQYLTEQDRILFASENPGGLHRDVDAGAQGTPECDLGTTTDLDSNSSLAATPQPVTNPSDDVQSNLFNNHSFTSRHVGYSINLDDQRPSASSSLYNQQPPPGDLSMDMNQQSPHTTLSFLTGSAAFPLSVASRGKPRRGMMRRAVFSDSQRVGLEKRFQLQKYISKPDRKKLAEKLGLKDSQVKIWFQNRRMKWRNSKERELLSAGGSREQTLPTRNNPNPDLSDVGETIKRLVSSSNGVGAA